MDRMVGRPNHWLDDQLIRDAWRDDQLIY